MISRSPQLEVIKSMEGFVEEHLDSLLVKVEDSWQPSDYLPDMASDNWKEQLTAFRLHAQTLPDELLVVLVGDMVTEEALPTYQTWLNRLSGLTDITGASPSPWARWSRGWTAEENRHGDLLNKYLYLTGTPSKRPFIISLITASIRKRKMIPISDLSIRLFRNARQKFPTEMSVSSQSKRAKIICTKFAG